MHLLRTDANLGSQTELSAIGETGGSVDIYAGSIYLRLECLGSNLVVGNDALAMSTAISGDVGNGFVE